MGSTTLSSGAITVRFDSGNPVSYLPSYLHTAIGAKFPTAKLDSGSGYYIVDCSIANQAGSVDFKFGGKTIKVAYEDIIWHSSSSTCVIGTQPTKSNNHVPFTCDVPAL